MGPIGKATLVAVLGTAVLVVAMSALEPDVPRALVAVYNLWLLGTVIVLVVAGIGAIRGFFDRITDGKRRSL